ncbi:hypothetical protein GA0061099_1003656 [Bradyrhizobium yuanmingense]|uniref:Uncharacterized protein n=1 Tax=Bradyrhizobium yuanmingense TaxID=108015 RepID=A0A1C3VDJ8_9BRAD|nr:hypothetical protein IQ15_03431 [Bradyrhizobium yuanmingense]SCB25863.1 hypothetical protein GA0061099_1003656 [Bradyrhizobium yuanmingense]
MPVIADGPDARFDPMLVAACGVTFLVKSSVAAKKPLRPPLSPQSIYTRYRKMIF